MRIHAYVRLETDDRIVGIVEKKRKRQEQWSGQVVNCAATGQVCSTNYESG